jgi:hypothetical protein
LKSASLSQAVSQFGAAVKSKLSGKGIAGSPEDQLRAPLETLVRDLAEILLFRAGDVVLVGETALELKTRPDYAVKIKNALVGFIEIKAPGKGADPRKFKNVHDAEQWQKLKLLPNVIYTDGNDFSLWRSGKLQYEIVRLSGDVETAGAKLAAPPNLERLFAEFLRWEPIPPTSARGLAELSAGLCRLLRDEVTEQLALGTPALTGLAEDWRKLLFPDASNDEFADGYAQAVTFGLLMARTQEIPLHNGLDSVAKALMGTNTVIGAAFRVLTDEADGQQALTTSLGTLTRVLDAVHWSAIAKGDPEAWLYFYEHFLEVYDNALRKRTGSYYTPPQVVTAMVRLVDEALRDPARFGIGAGLASPDVTLADPALGTGTYLLSVLRRIAETAGANQGPGAVPGIVRASLQRIIGFELQFGPFAVAQLRLLAEIGDLLNIKGALPGDVRPRLFVTNTLGNPDEEHEYIPQILRPLADSRLQANKIKRSEPITVVIGNPPYKEKAKGKGGWIETGSGKKGMPSPLEQWQPPPSWGIGAHAKHLRNLYVYFWRWATWKVFGDAPSSPQAAKGRRGIVCFISVAGFLNGPGFQRMRDYMRRTADEIWVIDCSPEQHQPPVNSRIFQGVQQPVCIVLMARTTKPDEGKPARVRFTALPVGLRDDKFAALTALPLDGPQWSDCPTEWRAPFLPESASQWASYPALDDLFVYSGSGVMPGRTWVIAPDKQSLGERWKALVRESDPVKKEKLFHPHEGGDRTIKKEWAKTKELTGLPLRRTSIQKDSGPVVAAAEYGFRSFDRQWIIPDYRLLNRPNPELWKIHSKQQVYLTALMQHSPSGGPAATFTALMPDLHHYKGSFGGRAFPLWGDAAAHQSNFHTGVLARLAEIYGAAVTPQDLLAYIAAIAAHSGYTKRFAADLKQPGLRIPMTADAGLFAEACELGRRVIWLHTFGERFVDAKEGRSGEPRPAQNPPTIPKGGAIPSTADEMPDSISYDGAKRRLHVGLGYIDNVPPGVWNYEVSGKQVLTQWFSYRRRDRERPIIGDRRPPSPLGDIQPNGWLSEYTTELLRVINVLALLVEMEPAQADLLRRVCDGPTISASVLTGELAVDESAN